MILSPDLLPDNLSRILNPSFKELIKEENHYWVNIRKYILFQNGYRPNN